MGQKSVSDEVWQAYIKQLEVAIAELLEESRQLLVDQLRRNVIDPSDILNELGFKQEDNSWKEHVYLSAYLADGLIRLRFSAGAKKPDEVRTLEDKIQAGLNKLLRADEDSIEDSFAEFLPPSVNNPRCELELLTGASRLPLEQSADRLLVIHDMQDRLARLKTVSPNNRCQSAKDFRDFVNSSHGIIVAGASRLSRFLGVIHNLIRSLLRKDFSQTTPSIKTARSPFRLMANLSRADAHLLAATRGVSVPHEESVSSIAAPTA